MKNFVSFIKYNNFFPITISFVLLATSATFASSEEVRDLVYDTQEVVRSVDNTLLVSINLESFSYDLQINEVREDLYNYYVDYSYQTLAIDDYVWKIVLKNETLKVSKKALEESYLKDLGLYTAKNLSDKINAEAYYLSRAQVLERERGQSQKVVAIEYSGLVGSFINTKEKVVEGYSPIIALEQKRDSVEIMDPTEISAKTKEVLLLRRKAEIEEQKRLAEEIKNKTDDTTSSTTVSVDNSVQDVPPAILGESIGDTEVVNTEKDNPQVLKEDNTPIKDNVQNKLDDNNVLTENANNLESTTNNRNNNSIPDTDESLKQNE